MYSRFCGVDFEFSVVQIVLGFFKDFRLFAIKIIFNLRSCMIFNYFLIVLKLISLEVEVLAPKRKLNYRKGSKICVQESFENFRVFFKIFNWIYERNFIRAIAMKVLHAQIEKLLGFQNRFETVPHSKSCCNAVFVYFWVNNDNNLKKLVDKEKVISYQ